jgi:hypothetical protein
MEWFDNCLFILEIEFKLFYIGFITKHHILICLCVRIMLTFN